MKIYMKNKFLSIGEGSEVLDEQKKPIYVVKGVPLSFTREKNIYDMEGKLLYVIKNRLFNIFYYKTKIFNDKNEKLADISIAKGFVREKYKISGLEDEMEVVGSFASRKSKITRNGQEIAQLQEESSIINDCYSITADEKEIPFLTAVAVAFDNLTDLRERKRK